MKLTLEEHGEFVRNALAAGKSRRQIATALGCHNQTVITFAKEHGLDPPEKPKRKVAFVPGTQPTEQELLEAELKELRAAVRKDRKSDIRAEQMLAEVRAITPSAAPRYEAPEAAEGSGHEHVHVLLLSDLHCGEVVDNEAMNGLGEYNFEILQERMTKIHRALVSFQNARPYPISQLRVWSLGDMVGGRHHQELAETNEFGPIAQTWQTGMLLGQFLEPLVEVYPEIHYTSVDGNHSRINEKHQSKQVFESFDWLAAKISELYLRQYPTIHHNHPRAGMTIDKVAGKTALLWHGDGVKSSMPGVPWGGLMRRFNALKSTYAQIGEYLDYLAVGHFHQLNAVKGIFMNGSVKGPDEHVLKNYGTADTWEQMLLTFDTTVGRLTDISFINGQ